MIYLTFIENEQNTSIVEIHEFSTLFKSHHRMNYFDHYQLKKIITTIVHL